MKHFSENVCQYYNLEQITSEEESWKYWRSDSEFILANPNAEVNYDFYLTWIPGCTPRNEKGELINQTVAWKICTSYFIAAYERCNNEGVGGSIEAGCIKYTFTGGRSENVRDYSHTIVPV
ncbi:unnamed protein product [Zymoseptoria tritici ST99CH_1E4]|uniref:Uncharacterized protein n=1 Tax=Zymoseptoria tritici ST99CH_1E4 TaxID=1276532 RepID=A0A2H1FX39_ZYMTR|nr:unnamed protein product [Zymoseptoria tritici ST99CH_1E4]